MSEINPVTVPRALDSGNGEDSRWLEVAQQEDQFGCQTTTTAWSPASSDNLLSTSFSDAIAEAAALSKPPMHRAIDKHTDDYPHHSYSSSSTDSAELKTELHTDEMMAAQLDPDMVGMLTNNWNLNAGPPPPVANWGLEAPALYVSEALTTGASNQHAPLSGSTMITPPTSIMDMATSEPCFGSDGSMINNNNMQQPMGPPMEPFTAMDSGFVMPYQDCATMPALYDGGGTYKPHFDSATINDAEMNQFAPNGAHLVDNQLEESSYLSSNGAQQTIIGVGPTFQGAVGSNTLFNEVAQPPAATLAAIDGFAIPELSAMQEDDDTGSGWNGSSSGFSAVASSPIVNNAIPTSTTPTLTNVITQVPDAASVHDRRICALPTVVVVEGCEKSSQGGNMCIKHGGGKRCKHPGCDKAAQTNALCKAHGGGPRCQFSGCTKSSQGGGFCRAHGGGKRCTAQSCNKGTQRGDFCALHGGSRFCEVTGCMRNDRGGGFCAHHGGGKRCSVANCNRSCRRNGLCSTHLRLLGHEVGEANTPTPVAISAAMPTSTDASRLRTACRTLTGRCVGWSVCVSESKMLRITGSEATVWSRLQGDRW
ncbi:hypothetical protein PC113_g54 [Phytophthora cactorum]|uniref:WRKY19-like zinc finger domain-containing protein n=1 Tax=Phytophthora cactorum TaxID=29920 RepID=A0A8T1A3R6_9STRA|nr:hypothetical protein PC113_g54 [Phytophthora cactorum]